MFDDVDKITRNLKRLAIAKAVASIVMWICAALIVIEVIFYIHDHGLKDLLELICHGPKPDTQ